MFIVLIIFWLLLISINVAAWRWGKAPERAAASFSLIAAILTVIARSNVSTRYQTLELEIFVVDLVFLIGLAVIAVRSDRGWAIWASTFQALAVLSHIGKMINPDLWRLGYQLMATWSALPVLAVIALGILRQRRKMNAI